MKTTIVQAAAVIALGWGAGLLTSPVKAPVPTSAHQKTTQPSQMPSAAPNLVAPNLVAQPQQASGWGTPITITVSGTGIVDGAYVAQEMLTGSQTVLVNNQFLPRERCWQVNLGGGASGWVKARRELILNPITQQYEPSWGASVGVTSGNAVGATSGQWVGQTATTQGVTVSSPINLVGQDFSCSGTMGWVGSPVFNGSQSNAGRTVAVTVSP